MVLISGALAGVSLGGNAFAQGTPKRGGILRISAPANPSSLDPATGGAGSDHAFLFTMYDTLTEWEFETLKPRPGLVESWSFTDPTTFVLKIRSGVTFHERRSMPKRSSSTWSATRAIPNPTSRPIWPRWNRSR
jgi:peptide/nickel transport system permease protein/peptide/nickel transport system substrate-binding protein